LHPQGNQPKAAREVNLGRATRTPRRCKEGKRRRGLGDVRDTVRNGLPCKPGTESAHYEYEELRSKHKTGRKATVYHARAEDTDRKSRDAQMRRTSKSSEPRGRGARRQNRR